MVTPQNTTRGHKSPQATRNLILERDIIMTNNGDWKARNNLMKHFDTILYSLAEKHSRNTHDLNEYIKAGEAGLITAAKKYTPSIGATKFELFALDYIEKSMERRHSGGGFLSRLFGR